MMEVAPTALPMDGEAGNMTKTPIALALLAAAAGCTLPAESGLREDVARDHPRQLLPGELPRDLTLPEDVDPLPEWDPSLPFVGLGDGRIQGAIGSSTDLDLQSDLSSVYDDGYYTQIEVYARTIEGKRVMLQLGVARGDGGPLLQPGLGFRTTLGYLSDSTYVGALGCEGMDTLASEGVPFTFTEFDEEPCEVGVDTERDPENPDELLVALSATFSDAGGACPRASVGGGTGLDLPDEDGDGDGDLIEPGPGNGANPVAFASFRLSR
jgi:hypothetical protein